MAEEKKAVGGRTPNQKLGERGVRLVIDNCYCPKCKPEGKTLRALGTNFKCADIICDFCGYLAQVKAKTVADALVPGSIVQGAAWGPQKERMDAGIYFPLFLVLVAGKRYSIFYLSADLQPQEMFVPRKPLSAKARRAGWKGFNYDLRKIHTGALVCLKPPVRVTTSGNA